LNVRAVAFVFVALLCCSHESVAQLRSDSEPYSRRNTFTVFGEYSNDSSHIVLGRTPNRKLAGVGAQYERRLLGNEYVTWSYEAEFRPFIVSSDPFASYTSTDTFNGTTSSPVLSSGMVSECVAGTSTYTFTGPFGTESGVIVTQCSRVQTLAQGGSPIGFRFHLMPRRKLQLMFSSDGGYMYSTKPIPIPTAGGFNFTFNFGAGFEYFYKPHRSVRLEYLVQHYSNAYTAGSNPGVDSQFIRVGYSFGH